jgi:hypothetical protein
MSVSCLIHDLSSLIFNIWDWVNEWLFLQVLLLMSTALNLPIPKAPPPMEYGGSTPTDLRSRQQRIAEITEMIHVSPLEILLSLYLQQYCF